MEHSYSIAMALMIATAIASPANAQDGGTKGWSPMLRGGGVPVNDECADAIALSIYTATDCPDSATQGNNGAATFIGNDPQCLPGVNFTDVWYSFNSDVNSEVILEVYLGDATFIGIEILDGCSGSTIDCGYTPQDIYVLTVTPFTDYVVRVFTDLDQGAAGSFGLCLNAVPPPPQCDGGTVKTTEQLLQVTVCNDAGPAPVGFTNTSLAMEAYTYFLCDEMDTVLYILAGDTLDADTLPIGTYHIYGFSHNGVVNTHVIGERVNQAESDGSCFDLSDNFVIMWVELCTGMPSNDAAEQLVYPVPSDGNFHLVDPGPATEAAISLHDMTGRVVYATRGTLQQGRPVGFQLKGLLAPGHYFMAIQRPDSRSVMRIEVR